MRRTVLSMAALVLCGPFAFAGEPTPEAAKQESGLAFQENAGAGSMRRMPAVAASLGLKSGPTLSSPGVMKSRGPVAPPTKACETNGQWLLKNIAKAAVLGLSVAAVTIWSEALFAAWPILAGFPSFIGMNSVIGMTALYTYLGIKKGHKREALAKDALNGLVAGVLVAVGIFINIALFLLPRL